MSGQSGPVERAGGHVLALCGGVGGAKLALGLYRVLPPHGLTVVVNTGDDFEHLGLHVSPDLDTVLYTLAGWSDPERGWGRADETWQLHGGAGSARRTRPGSASAIATSPCTSLRTQWLGQGETLTAFARHVAGRMGIAADILPMSDDPVRTIVETTRRTARLPALFRRAALRASGERNPLRRSGSGSPVAGALARAGAA